MCACPVKCRAGVRSCDLSANRRSIEVKGGCAVNDQAIIELYWARDQLAIRESDEKYGPYCRTIAHNVLQDRLDSEECVNDTWHRAWESMPPQRPGLLRAFFGTITRNLALNRWEKQHAQKRGGGQLPLALEELSECLPATDSVERAVEERELTALLELFLESLPRQARVIFLRRYWFLMPVKDIAKGLSVSESKVKMSLLRSRNKLRELLEKEGICL